MQKNFESNKNLTCLNTLNKKLGPLNLLRTSTRGCFGRSRLGLEKFEFALLSNVGFDSSAPRIVMLWHCAWSNPANFSYKCNYLATSSQFESTLRMHTCRHLENSKLIGPCQLCKQLQERSLIFGTAVQVSAPIADQLSGCLSAGWSLVWQCTPPPLAHELSISIT